MAKEVLHDAMGWASVRTLVRAAGDWTPPGPGARRGLNRLHGRALNFDSGEARFITEMRLLLCTLRSLDPAFCKSVNLNIHDVQFQLCEYDKYCRVGDGGFETVVLALVLQPAAWRPRMRLANALAHTLLMRRCALRGSLLSPSPSGTRHQALERSGAARKAMASFDDAVPDA